MYIYIYTYIYIFLVGSLSFTRRAASPDGAGARSRRAAPSLHPVSPLEDSRLFGPSPWKILATTYEKMDS